MCPRFRIFRGVRVWKNWIWLSILLTLVTSIRVSFVYLSCPLWRSCIWPGILVKTGSVAKTISLLMLIPWRAIMVKLSHLHRESRLSSCCLVWRRHCSRLLRRGSWSLGSRTMMRRRGRNWRNIWHLRRKLSRNHITPESPGGKCMRKWRQTRRKRRKIATHRNSSPKNKSRCTRVKVRSGNVMRVVSSSVFKSMRTQITLFFRFKFQDISRLQSWRWISIQSGLVSG